jgi:RimJ/RimL family protein N-acetyltransferase
VLDIRLIPLDETHLDEVDALMTDPDVLRFTRFPSPPDPEFPKQWLDRYEQGRLDGSREGFAAVTTDGGFVGVALAPHIDAEAREVELGYIVAPELRGKGVATELLRQLTTWAFDRLGALRAQLLIDVDNVASQQVAQRAGYQLEGVMRSTHLKGDVRTDTQIWSRLPSDPQPGVASPS